MSLDAFLRSGRSIQEVVGSDVLQPLVEGRRPQRVLLAGHARAPELPLAAPARVQAIRLGCAQGAQVSPLRCSVEALPFCSAAFEMVVLQDLVSDGHEAVFREALRVLAPGGDLLISGLHANGLRYRLGNRTEHFPGLRLHRVIHQLKSESFTIERCLRSGLLGVSRPVLLDNWRGLALPLADHIVLHAHHRSGMTSGNILRFRKVQPAGVVSVALESWRRRAAES